MQKLSNHLHFFIRTKLQTDSSWKSIRVIFSGAEVPGEGEHKIMMFIRRMKMQPDYCPGLRHCLYGLDADLIMLSLVSHEPHFSLLREEVVFGNRAPGARKQLSKFGEFQFLHISLLRQYIHLEFQSDDLGFDYDLERTIDDWVFLCYLVGNDFLPHIPTMNIAEGALDKLFEMYKKLLPAMGGYITYRGDLNLSRFQIILTEVGKQENLVFETRLEEASRMSRGKGRNRRNRQMELAEVKDPYEIEAAAELAFDEEFATLGYDQDGPDKVHIYYHKKFKDMFVPGASLSPREHVNRLCHAYLEGLVWVLKYYYQGCCSWKWFFPAFYAPLASDLAKITCDELKFELGRPFRPLEQLLGVLPPASAQLLPPSLRPLMLNENSPVKDLYPPTFQVDMNGARSSWEGIALIPFIDEKRLLTAVADMHAESNFTPAERTRNSRHGKDFEFKFDGDQKIPVPSTIPRFLPDLVASQCDFRPFELPPIPRAGSVVRNRAAPDDVQHLLPVSVLASSPTFVSKSNNSEESFEEAQNSFKKEFDDFIGARGFIPDLCLGEVMAYDEAQTASVLSLAVVPSIASISVNVFGTESKKDTLCLRVPAGPSLETVIKNNLGRKVYVEWPFPRLAIAESLCAVTTRGVEVHAKQLLCLLELSIYLSIYLSVCLS